MSHERVFVVLNPVAGTKKADALRATIVNHLSMAGWHYTLHETRESQDVSAVVREAREDATIVVAAGGDGTVSATASGLVGSDVPLGIVPSGTGNALARDMGIPLNPKQALHLITGPHRKVPVDALRVDERHYFLNLSIGVTAAAMADTKRNEKQRLGLVAYLITGIQKLVGLQPAGFELTIDDAFRYVHAADILVTNSGIIGISALEIAPDGAIDDGEVSVCIIRGKTLFDYISALANALIGRPRNQRMRCIPACQDRKSVV